MFFFARAEAYLICQIKMIRKDKMSFLSMSYEVIILTLIIKTLTGHVINLTPILTKILSTLVCLIIGP